MEDLSLKGKTIWLVEDDPHLGSALQDFLGYMGASVKRFDTPWLTKEEFKRLMSTHVKQPPDLVITDWDFSQAPVYQAPSQRFREMGDAARDDGMSALSLIREMHLRCPDLRFILTTGDTGISKRISLPNTHVLLKGSGVLETLMDALQKSLSPAQKRHS